MNNASIVNTIDNKLNLSNSSLGTGLKMFQVNPNPPAEIHSGCALLNTTGAKYITDTSANAITIGNFKMFTNNTATFWKISATFFLRLRIKGVDENNNEITEDITVDNLDIYKTTTKKYKIINDINLVDGGQGSPTGQPMNDTDHLRCYPDDSSIKLDVTLLRRVKINPFFMCSNNSSGIPRKARLLGITSLYNTGANTNISLHVFKNNQTVGSSNIGAYTVDYCIYDITSNTSSLNNCITIPDGVVEIEPGDLAVFYREGATTPITIIHFTWGFYY